MLPFRLLRYFIDRLFVVIGAFLGSQIPPFMQQYTHRLAGHVHELDHLIQNLHQVASYSHKTLDVYIQKFLNSSDPDFVHQGKFMEGVVERWENLSYSLQRLQESSLWQRPLVFIQDLQPTIAHSTLESFQPGFNLNLEGVCYAGLGLFLGFIAYHLLVQSLFFVQWIIWKLISFLRKAFSINRKRKENLLSSESYPTR